MSVKTKMTLTLAAWGYALLVGPLAGFAVYRLNALAKDSLAENELGRIAGFIIVLTALYVIRAVLFTLPLLAENTKLRSISKYGFLALIVPELVVLYAVVHFTITPPTSTTNPDSWADAFAPIVVLVPLVLSTFAQMMGMAIGWLTVVIKR